MKQLDPYKVEVAMAYDTSSMIIPEDEDAVLYRIRREAEADSTRHSLIFDIRDISDIDIQHDVDTDKVKRATVHADFGEFDIDPMEVDALVKLWMKRSYKR